MTETRTSEREEGKRLFAQLVGFGNDVGIIVVRYHDLWKARLDEAEQRVKELQEALRIAADEAGHLSEVNGSPRSGHLSRNCPVCAALSDTKEAG